MTISKRAKYWKSDFIVAPKINSSKKNHWEFKLDKWNLFNTNEYAYESLQKIYLH